MRKLKHKDLKEYRDKQREKQFNRCPLCSREIQDPVQDHDHNTGHVRMVLCRLCNSLEGKIENWIKRYGRGVNRIHFLDNVLQYWSTNWEGYPLHPKHKTDEEKAITNLKRRAKNAKRQSTKDSLNKKIRVLKKQRREGTGY